VWRATASGDTSPIRSAAMARGEEISQHPPWAVAKSTDPLGPLSDDHSGEQEAPAACDVGYKSVIFRCNFIFFQIFI
jgi:hypothetical protein